MQCQCKGGSQKTAFGIKVDLSLNISIVPQVNFMDCSVIPSDRRRNWSGWYESQFGLQNVLAKRGKYVKFSSLSWGIDQLNTTGSRYGKGCLHSMTFQYYTSSSGREAQSNPHVVCYRISVMLLFVLLRSQIPIVGYFLGPFEFQRSSNLLHISRSSVPV